MATETASDRVPSTRDSEVHPCDEKPVGEDVDDEGGQIVGKDDVGPSVVVDEFLQAIIQGVQPNSWQHRQQVSLRMHRSVLILANLDEDVFRITNSDRDGNE